VTRRSNLLQKHSFGVLYTGAFFVGYVLGPTGNEK
jgi:hypothetical protein